MTKRKTNAVWTQRTHICVIILSSIYFVSSSRLTDDINSLDYIANCDTRKSVPWLRRLVSGLSSRRDGFAPRSVHVGFVMKKLALGQVFLRFLRFPCQYHSTVAVHTHVSSGGWKILGVPLNAEPCTTVHRCSRGKLLSHNEEHPSVGGFQVTWDIKHIQYINCTYVCMHAYLHTEICSFD
jgi:hypothetical protein